MAKFTSGGFDLLVLHHHHINVSLHSFFFIWSVREGMAILVTLMLTNYGRIKKIFAIFFLGHSKCLKSTKSAEGL